MTTTAELLEVMRDAFAAQTLTVTAGHDAPAEMTGTPAVILRPGDPFIAVNRHVGTCPEVHWAVQLVGSRFDLATSLGQLTDGYIAVVAALRGIGLGQVGALGLVQPTDIASVPMISGTFNLVVPHDPGGP